LKPEGGLSAPLFQPGRKLPIVYHIFLQKATALPYFPQVFEDFRQVGQDTLAFFPINFAILTQKAPRGKLPPGLFIFIIPPR
jgi:hypothetical protein